jgi:hypothetical protein
MAPGLNIASQNQVELDKPATRAYRKNYYLYSISTKASKALSRSFCPSFPHRKQVQANAQKAHVAVPTDVKETADKVEKVSFNWAKLIARIYEADPLICSNCGKKIKIIAFVTHSSQIWRILTGIGWPTDIPKFDPEYQIVTWDICQLIPGTENGFSKIASQINPEIGPDPPLQHYPAPIYESYDRDAPHWDDYGDPPHWQD